MTAVPSRLLKLISLAAVFAAISSCAFGNRLEVKSAGSSDVSGNYTVIFYGCNHFDDLETIAILAKEGTDYTFEPYAPGFKYRVEKEVPGKTALEEAGQFVNCHSSFRAPVLGRIVDEKGETIGFEMRPLYYPLTFGVDDVLDTDYRVKDHKVVVWIRLKPHIERMLSDGGRRERDND